MSRRHLAALACFIAPSIAAAQGLPDAPPTPPPPLRVAVSSGLQGDLVQLACVPPSQRTSHLGELSRAFGRLSPATLRLDAGDLLGASAASHLAVTQSPEVLAAAVAATGLRALGLGHRDLGAERRDLTARARALRARGIPVILSNLRCEESAQSLCDVIDDDGDAPVLVPTEAGPVAVIALVAPSALQAVARDRSEGVSLTAPDETLGRMTLAARAAGARYVVAFYDPDWPGTLDDTLRVVRALPQAQRPDVVFAQDLERQVAALEVERGMAMQVLAAEPGRVLQTELPSLREHAVVEPEGEPPQAVTMLRDTLSDRLCALAREELPGARLTRPMDRASFTDLVLDVLREEARAEISVINVGAVRPVPSFPWSGRITRVDVLGAVPFEDSLRVTRIKGDALRDFMRSDRAARFRVRGVQRDGDAFLVNGRPLEEAQEYRLITTAFVADGGDGGIADEGDLEFMPYETAALRDTLLRWLSVPRSGDITHAPVDPADRTRWTFRLFVDASWNETAIANGAGYQDPQLVRSQGTAIQVDVEARANAEQPRFTLDNTLRLRLGLQRTLDDSGDTGLVKVADLITLRDQLAWRGVWRRRHWYTPIPYVESYLESEFTPPDASMATRDFHHLQWRPTGGVRFELPLRANLNVGAGVDWETLDPTATPIPVAVLRGELPPTVLFHIQDRDVEGQLFTEVAWRAPWASTAETLVRLNARLSVPVIEPLSIAVSYDLFARQRADDPWSLSHDINLGIQLDVLRTLQAFSY